jgi:hypothetical protein
MKFNLLKWHTIKLEIVPELINEGLTVEQTARVLKLLLELVQQ